MSMRTAASHSRSRPFLFLTFWTIVFGASLSTAQEVSAPTAPSDPVEAPSEFSDVPPPETSAVSSTAPAPAISETDSAAVEKAVSEVDRTRVAAEEAQAAYERAIAEAAAAKKRADDLAAAAAAAAAAKAKEDAAREAAEQRELREKVGVPALERELKEARRVAEEARAEAEAARQIAREAQAAAAAYGKRFARTGFLVGIGGNYLLEDFDTRLEVDNGRSLHAVLGYRVHRHVALELRGEWLDDFEIRADDPAGGAVEVDLDGFLITVGPKFYPWTGSIQPFVGFGLGIFRAGLEGTGRAGTRINNSETDSVVRVSGGLDYFLSENLVLNLEAAYVTSGGELDVVSYGSLGAGVTFRF